MNGNLLKIWNAISSNELRDEEEIMTEAEWERRQHAAWRNFCSMALPVIGGSFLGGMFGVLAAISGEWTLIVVLFVIVLFVCFAALRSEDNGEDEL